MRYLMATSCRAIRCDVARPPLQRVEDGRITSLITARCRYRRGQLSIEASRPGRRLPHYVQREASVTSSARAAIVRFSQHSAICESVATFTAAACAAVRSTRRSASGCAGRPARSRASRRATGSARSCSEHQVHRNRPEQVVVNRRLVQIHVLGTVARRHRPRLLRLRQDRSAGFCLARHRQFTGSYPPMRRRQ